MLFLDDFLEMLDELPSELRDRCTEMRQIDLEVQTGVERNQKEILEFFETAAQLSEMERQQRYAVLRKEYARLRVLGEEKVSMAERMQDLVEKYVQHLEKEKTHFKYELEADNPGVTEAIETRFSNYVESVIALRKERKRKHPTSNGRATNGNAHYTYEDVAKAGKFITDGFSLSSVVQTDLGVTDEELLSPMMPMLSGGPGRKGTPAGEDVSSPATPTVHKKRPSLTSAALKSSLSSVASNLNGISVSPAISEKSWSSSALLPPDDHSPNTSRSVPSPFSHMHSPSMPTFVGPESRHGRPRKLTTRVQEMFSEAVQRQRRHHAVAAPVELEERADGSSGEDSDDAQKTWCFCGESSYGDMVACDNKECVIQWFHYGCVGIVTTPKGKWYCPQCTLQRESISSDQGSTSSI